MVLCIERLRSAGCLVSRERKRRDGSGGSGGRAAQGQIQTPPHASNWPLSPCRPACADGQARACVLINNDHHLTRHPLIMTTYDTIILGAGFAGLVCARQLAAKGFSVLVVEVRPLCPERTSRPDRPEALTCLRLLSHRAGTGQAAAPARTWREDMHPSTSAAAGFTASSRARPSARLSRASVSCVPVVPQIVPALRVNAPWHERSDFDPQSSHSYTLAGDSRP